MTVIFDVPFNSGADDVSSIAAVATIGSATSMNNDVFCQGIGSWFFDGTGNLTTGTLSYPNNSLYAFVGSFIVRGRVFFTDLTDTNQMFISFYERIGNNRSWHMRRSGDEFHTFWSDDGSTSSPAVLIERDFTWEVDTWYDVASSRDDNDDLRMYVEGEQLGDPVNIPFDLHFNASVGPLRLGGFSSTNDRLLTGYLDGWTITTGESITEDFTPVVCGAVATSTAGTPLIIGSGGRTARRRSSDNRGVSASGGRVIR